MSNEIRYTVETKVSGQCVEQSISNTSVDGVASLISRQVCNLQEESMKKALVQLGWTPPSEKTGLASELVDRAMKRQGLGIIEQLKGMCEGSVISFTPKELEGEFGNIPMESLKDLLPAGIIFYLEDNLGGEGKQRWVFKKDTEIANVEAASAKWRGAGNKEALWEVVEARVQPVRVVESGLTELKAVELAQNLNRETAEKLAKERNFPISMVFSDRYDFRKMVKPTPFDTFKTDMDNLEVGQFRMIDRNYAIGHFRMDSSLLSKFLGDKFLVSYYVKGKYYVVMRMEGEK